MGKYRILNENLWGLKGYGRSEALFAYVVRYRKTWQYLSDYNIYTHILVGECFHSSNNRMIMR